MRIVDAHLHLVDQERFSYAWLKDYPTLDRSWTGADYFDQARPLGIQSAVHIEVDVDPAEMEAETRFMLAVHPHVAGAVISGRPESEGFPAYLEQVRAMAGVKGMRRILHTSPDALSTSDLFAENIRRLGAAGLPFDLCVLSRQLPLGAALVKKCPDTQFVLDHCGNPDVAGKALDPWRTEIATLARMPNVAVKISGIVASAGPDWTVDDLKPFVAHVIECFGWERVIWGSDYPVVTLTADLARWLAAAKEIVAGASHEEQAQLFHRNAERIYRLDLP